MSLSNRNIILVKYCKKLFKLLLISISTVKPSCGDVSSATVSAEPRNPPPPPPPYALPRTEEPLVDDFRLP